MKKKNRMLGLLLAFALLIGNLYPVPIVRAEEQVQQTVVQQEQQVEGAEKQGEITETPSDAASDEVTGQKQEEETQKKEAQPEEEASKMQEQQKPEEENSETVEAYSLDEEESEIEEQAETEEIPQSITGNYLGVKTQAKVYSDFENDIWLQYQQKEMQVGDMASLRPWRAEQIVSNTTANDVARPNFRFEIIAGDSVSLDTAVSSEKAVVTAVKPGTSIVKVTYDAIDYKGLHWDGISAVNTAYAVYTVGEKGTAVIETNREFKDWRHYDTVYYKNGSTVSYRFTVNAQNAVSVKVTCNGFEISGSGNNYIANLENRSNIIGIETTDADGNVKSMWRVIDARFIEVNVTNKTNPEQPLNAGDTATVSFKGITMPVYKLATIYNPCMTAWGGKSTRVQYHNAELGDFEGACDQWDLARKNSFDVTFAANGEYVFTSEKGIYCEWWGSPLGADITANGSGEPNLNAPVLNGNFSKLPDFKILVGESENGNEEEKPGSNVTVQPAEIHPGDEVTVTLKNVKVPETVNPTHAMETRYNTDIPGVSVIKSKDAKDNEELLKTLTFTVPEDTLLGTYHLTNGRVYKKYGGKKIQGVFWTGMQESEFPIEETAEIEIEVKETDEVIAQKVTDQINSLGEIISVLQEEQVIAARAAYEALTDAQKDLVSNLLVLEAAEIKIEELKELLKPVVPELPIIPEVPEQEKKPQNPDEAEKPEKPEESSKPGIVTKPNVQSALDKTKPSGVLGKAVRSLQRGEAVPAGRTVESNMVNAEIKDGIVSATQVKAIKGKDKNLRMRGKLEDGTAYTMILNGKDIKTSSAICTTITRKSPYEEEIQILAPEPEIIVLENKGEFPGEMLVELSTEKEDGNYLLFHYDSEKEKAVYVQKVKVQKGKVKFLVSEGGSYFIDKKAKVKTVSELKANKSEVSDEIVEAEPKVTKAQSFGTDVNKTSHQPFYIIFGTAGVAGIFAIGYLLGRKKRGK